jgi:hypothetical protein
MPDHPGFQPGENVTASAARIRKWLELFPDYESIAPEFAFSPGFVTDGWPSHSYAIHRRDLEAVLNDLEAMRDALEWQS